MNHYLGFLGLFGCIISLIEAYFFNEYSTISNFLKYASPENRITFFWNILGFMLANFIIYSMIVVFIQRSGATLLNISNVTTVIWGMLSDIILFEKPFYVLYVIAFCFEITGVIIFSM